MTIMSILSQSHGHQIGKDRGFTIVELLVVIVVIGILAAITIVAFNGVQRRVQISAMQSELRQGVVQLEVAKSDNASELYPSTPEAANLKSGSGRNFQYTYTAATNSYCLTITTSMVGVPAYYATNTSTAPTEGTCPGHESSSTALTGWTKVSVGYSHRCGVYNTRAYCWGTGYDGQIGNGVDYTVSTTPIAVVTSGVLSGKTVTDISASKEGAHTCAVADGQAYCWGTGSSGQLGNGGTSLSSSPVAVSIGGVLAGKTVTKISVGYNFSCAIASGQAYCWGLGTGGQLGSSGAAANSSVAVAVDTSGVLSGKTISDISTGLSHTCVIADGAPYCWGAGGNGRLGNSGTLSSTVPVAVVSSGVLLAKTASGISAGDSHTCAIADGQAYCWGRAEGLGTGSASPDSSVPVAVNVSGALSGKTVTSISAYDRSACVVASNVPYCWGSLSAYSPLAPHTLTMTGIPSGGPFTVIDIADNGTQLACVISNKLVYCMNTSTSGFTAIANP